jgi:hypothetical protein
MTPKKRKYTLLPDDILLSYCKCKRKDWEIDITAEGIRVDHCVYCRATWNQPLRVEVAGNQSRSKEFLLRNGML